jgi:hypothetical protein
MRNLIEAIQSRKPIVIWNPYKSNDTLTSFEFMVMVKIKGYTKIVCNDEWITAYQPSITTFGNETIRKYLDEAKRKKLNVYASLLEAEMNGTLESINLTGQSF